MAVRLNEKLVGEMPPPERGQRIVFDSEVAGFGLRLTPTGRTFVLDYRERKTGRQRRFSIGKSYYGGGGWSVQAARAEARKLRREIDAHIDPQGIRNQRRAAPTVADLVARFKAEGMTENRPRTVDDYTLIVDKHVLPALGRVKVADLALADIDKLHRSLADRPYIANRTVAVLSRMLNLAAGWGWRTGDNPAARVERFPEAKRRRYLGPGERPALLAAMAEHGDRQTVNALRMAMLTGCRIGEALAAKWTDFDFDRGVWTKPGATTNRPTDHAVPISPPLRQLLVGIPRKGDYVFPARHGDGRQTEYRKSWTAICRAAGIEDLRVQDLRHSFASEGLAAGLSLPMIGALLGHASPVTTARYAHLADDPARVAMNRIASRIVGGENLESGKVVPITAKRAAKTGDKPGPPKPVHEIVSDSSVGRVWDGKFVENSWLQDDFDITYRNFERDDDDDGGREDQ